MRPNSSIQPFVGGADEGPGGACFPGMAVIFTPIAEGPDAILTKSSKQVSHVSSAVTAVKFSEEGDLDVSMDFAFGVVIIGRSRRRKAST